MLVHLAHADSGTKHSIAGLCNLYHRVVVLSLLKLVVCLIRFKHFIWFSVQFVSAVIFYCGGLH